MSSTGLQSAGSTGSLNRPLSDKLEETAVEGRRQKAEGRRQKAEGRKTLLRSAYCLLPTTFYSVKLARRVSVNV